MATVPHALIASPAAFASPDATATAMGLVAACEGAFGVEGWAATPDFSDLNGGGPACGDRVPRGVCIPRRHRNRHGIGSCVRGGLRGRRMGCYTGLFRSEWRGSRMR